MDLAEWMVVADIHHSGPGPASHVRVQRAASGRKTPSRSRAGINAPARVFRASGPADRTRCTVAPGIGPNRYSSIAGVTSARPSVLPFIPFRKRHECHVTNLPVLRGLQRLFVPLVRQSECVQKVSHALDPDKRLLGAVCQIPRDGEQILEGRILRMGELRFEEHPRVAGVSASSR